MPKRKFYKNFEPYFGSQWFALTQDTVKFILRFIDENKDYGYQPAELLKNVPDKEGALIKVQRMVG